MQMNHPLPPEIIVEILSRVPADSLLRFRCVSKSWCAQIDDPAFIKTHLKKSIDSHSSLNLILANSNPNCLCLASFDSLDTVVELDNPLNYISDDADNDIKSMGFVVGSIKLVGCCNGLVCFANAIGRIVLMNPLTRKHQTLPFLPVEKRTDWVSRTYGFGYDPILDDYKVVRLVQYLTREGYFQNETPVYETTVYSLKSNAWRKIPGMPYLLGFDQKMGVLVGDALHWLVGRDGFRRKPDLIVGFDLGLEEFREVPFPELIVGQNNFFRLGVVGEWLSVILYGVVQLDVWVMKKYGVRESWIKLFSVTDNEFPSVKCMRTLAFSNNGDELLLGLKPCNIYWYNLKERSVKRVEIINKALTSFGAGVFHGSLVPLSDVVKKEQKEMKNRKKRAKFLSKWFKLRF